MIACGTNGSFRPVGSCWLFAVQGRDAFAFSATHIFDEVVRSEERHERSVASMPDFFRALKPRPIDLAHTRLKAIYRHKSGRGYLADILNVQRDGMTDVAVCQLSLQSDVPSEVLFERKMAIHAGPIPPNLEVAIVGYAGMKGTQSYIDEESRTSLATHFQQLTFEHGRCLEYYGVRGPRGPIGPCFEINVAAQHGMSGGPVLHKGYGDVIVGCGVISRGTAFGGDETTMASSLWPAYSFNIDALRGENDQPLTLVDLARQGWIDDKSNGPDNFRFIKTPDENSNGTIEWQR